MKIQEGKREEWREDSGMARRQPGYNMSKFTPLINS
jgi:hypothetical protein